MRIPTQLRAITFDTQTFSAPAQRLELFHSDQGARAGSAVDQGETEIVRWLTTQLSARSLILETLSLPSEADLSLRVRQPFLEPARSALGDIDLLACDPARPDQAVAVEWKRVKVRYMEEGREHINKISALGNSAGQVRDLASIGFGRSFLAVAAVVDARFEDGVNLPCRGASNETYTRILDVAMKLPLPADVGLIYVEIVQPTAKGIDQTATVAAAVVQAAQARNQAGRLSEKVANYFADIRRRQI